MTTKSLLGGRILEVTRFKDSKSYRVLGFLNFYVLSDGRAAFALDLAIFRLCVGSLTVYP